MSLRQRKVISVLLAAAVVGLVFAFQSAQEPEAKVVQRDSRVGVVFPKDGDIALRQDSIYADIALPYTGVLVVDRQEITELIRAWVSAVRAGELKGVLSAHAEDIVMFDVPPPDNGVRGIDAYRETWPPFFGWLQVGSFIRHRRAGRNGGRRRGLRLGPVAVWN